MWSTLELPSLFDLSHSDIERDSRIQDNDDPMFGAEFPPGASRVRPHLSENLQAVSRGPAVIFDMCLVARKTRGEIDRALFEME